MLVLSRSISLPSTLNFSWRLTIKQQSGGQQAAEFYPHESSAGSEQQHHHERRENTTAVRSIEGNGVTLDGADPLPESGWASLQNGLFRRKLPRTVWDRHLLIIDGRTDKPARVRINGGVVQQIDCTFKNADVNTLRAKVAVSDERSAD